MNRIKSFRLLVDPMNHGVMTPTSILNSKEFSVEYPEDEEFDSDEGIESEDIDIDDKHYQVY